MFKCISQKNNLEINPAGLRTVQYTSSAANIVAVTGECVMMVTSYYTAIIKYWTRIQVTLLIKGWDNQEYSIEER